MDTQKLWSEVYRREEYKPAWSSPGKDRNMKTITDKIIAENPERSLSVLDIGCGNGRNSRLFDNYESGLIDYTGIDFAEEAIKYCKKTYDKNRTFILQNITDPGLSHKKKYDIILDLGCFHSIPPDLRKSYIQNVSEMTGENTTLILGTWLKRNDSQNIIDPSYSPFVILDEWFFNTDDIKSLFSPYFTVEDTVVDNDIYPGVNDGFIYFTLRRSAITI